MRLMSEGRFVCSKIVKYGVRENYIRRTPYVSCPQVTNIKTKLEKNGRSSKAKIGHYWSRPSWLSCRSCLSRCCCCNWKDQQKFKKFRFWSFFFNLPTREEKFDFFSHQLFSKSTDWQGAIFGRLKIQFETLPASKLLLQTSLWSSGFEEKWREKSSPWYYYHVARRPVNLFFFLIDLMQFSNKPVSLVVNGLTVRKIFAKVKIGDIRACTADSGRIRPKKEI